jgi:hypothetical protein
MKFEDALGMNYTQPLNDCKKTQENREQFVRDTKEVLVVARAKLVELAAQPLAPISIKHANKEEEEDLYA